LKWQSTPQSRRTNTKSSRCGATQTSARAGRGATRTSPRRGPTRQRRSMWWSTRAPTRSQPSG
jgi:hypothetical protein